MCAQFFHHTTRTLGRTYINMWNAVAHGPTATRSPYVPRNMHAPGARFCSICVWRTTAARFAPGPSDGLRRRLGLVERLEEPGPVERRVRQAVAGRLAQDQRREARELVLR